MIAELDHYDDPAQIAPSDIYKLMIGMIVPRPIAFVSTVDAAGIRNLAPFSYFTACSSNPPVVCFCASVRSGPRGQTQKAATCSADRLSKKLG